MCVWTEITSRAVEFGMTAFGVYEQFKSITAILSDRDTFMSLPAPCYRGNEHCFGSIDTCKLNERSGMNCAVEEHS